MASTPDRTRRRDVESQRSPPDAVVGSRGIGAWLSRLAARLLPPRCLCCGAASDCLDLALCAGCRSELGGNQPCCPRCAEPLAREEPLCGRCLRKEPAFESAYVPFRYAWPLNGLVTRFKFGGDLAAGRCLARLFVEQFIADAVERSAVLVPVPLHERRLRQRGYDQARELARDVGRLLGLPVAHRLLRRVRATEAQTELDLPARRRNVRGAFEIDARELARLDSHEGGIALMDDVMTSGSTVAECARALQRAGRHDVRVWAVARAPARQR